MRRYWTSAVVVAVAAAALIMAVPQQGVNAHCQVPCGIYDDGARIHAMLEDATTIKKAIDQINSLAKSNTALNVNQATRWVATKEQHATHIITTVAEYFLTQKVKEVAPGADGYATYLETLAAHHKVMRAAMKTKQTVDLAAADALKEAIEKLGAYYPHSH